MPELGVTQCFSYWRSLDLGSREIIEGLVSDDHTGPSPVLAAYLAQWDGVHYWQRSPDGQWLVLIHERQAPRERWWLHGLLFALTLVTASIAGATLVSDVDPWRLQTLLHVRAGFQFSLPLLAILLAHESGHYLTARRYRVDSSPPYFVPCPPGLNLIGTFGAFIRLRSPLFDRRTLFDVGVAGPLAGMVVALPVLLLGLHGSIELPLGLTPALAHQFVRFNGQAVLVGDSLLLAACRAVLHLHGTLALTPLAAAGWVGVLVTSLNLLPLAQLDGGHVAFAMFGRAQAWIARAFWLLLIPLGHWWYGWWLWAVLGLLVGRGRLTHPPVVAPERPLDRRRMAVGWLAVALFVVTFMPIPVI